jgi:AcrR family transcriptional regulator
MARVTKEPDVRRDELLDVALGLCATAGFETMSIEQITTAAGVAKGTFYHYFTSKQDLMWQLVRRFGDSLFAFMEERMRGETGDALERLRALMLASAAWKMERMDSAMSYLPFLFMEDNYALRHKLYSEWLERTRPLLLDIVEQGAREGTFQVDDPDGATSIVLGLWFDAANRLWERAIAAPDEDSFVDNLVRGTKAIWLAEERILGVPPGSLTVEIDPDAMRGIRAHILLQLNGNKEFERTV